MIVDPRERTGRFRTTLHRLCTENERSIEASGEQGPIHAASRASILEVVSWIGRNVRKRPTLLDQKTYLGGYYVCPHSPLRGMSEVPHSISNRRQSLSQRVLPRARFCGIVGRVHTVLLLRKATRFQPMEMERSEDLCGLETRS